MEKLTAQLKKHRRLLLCALVCLTAFCVFAAVWLTHIRGQGDKSSGWAINDQFHSYLPLETRLTQQFTCDRDLLALSVVLAAQDPDTPPEGTLELELTNPDTGEVLARSTGELRYIYNGYDGYYTTLGLDAPVELASYGQVRYQLTLIPHYTGAGRLVVGYEAGGMPAGISLSADGAAVDGTIALKGVQARVGGFLTTFYWVIALCCIALLGGGFWLLTSKKIPLHRVVFCFVLLLGFLFNLVLPPYSAPDEKFHINQSFTLAGSIYNPYLPIGQNHIQDTIRRPSDQDPLVQVDEATVFTWQHLAKTFFTKNTDPTGAVSNFDGEYQVDTSYRMYLISTLGVLIGFWLHLGFVPTLFLGRLANLLVFAFFSAWAVKKTPVAKPVFALAALLPMTLHLAASYSRDSNLLALCFLFAALVLDLAFGPRENLGWKQLLLPALLCLLIAPSKIVYFPLVLLTFLIPAARLGRFSKWIKGGFIALCLAVLCGSSLLGITLAGFTQGTGTAAAGTAAASQTVQSESGGEAAKTSEIGETAQLNPEPQPEALPPAQSDAVCYTLPYILSHPVDTLELCIRSVVEQGDHYVRTLVGGTLGYFNLNNTLHLAWTWVILLYGLLTLAWLCPGGAELPAGGKALCLLTALACCGLAVLGCISWTPTYYTTIYGFQGRYFLPVLPLLLLARPKRLTLAANCERGIVYAACLVNVCVLLNAFLAVVAR